MTGTGCKIYSNLMVRIPQILHCHRSSIFLDTFKKIPYLVLLFALLPLKMNSYSGKLGNDDENLAINDYESHKLTGDPFSQFLEIFHLKISLRHV